MTGMEGQWGMLGVGAVVFLAGLASFFTPCVLPIVPAYLSLISGLSFEEMESGEMKPASRWQLFGGALAFVLGFSLVFILLMGQVVTALSQMSPVWHNRLQIAFGVVIFLFAFHMLGVIKIKALFHDKRFHLNANRWGIAGAFLIGVAFAFGWSPCIGPQLGAVMALAASTAKVSLLVVYSIGLAVPFLLAALFVHFFINSMKKMTRYLPALKIISGVLLLVMGIFLVTDSLGMVSASFEKLLNRIK